MWLKKLSIIALFLSLTGFIQAQEVPTDVTVLESYDMPGYFMVCTTSAGAVQLVQDGDQTPQGEWNVISPGNTGVSGTVTFLPVSLANHMMRHRGFVFYCDPVATDALAQNDSTFVIVPGLADPEAVSFRSVNYTTRYLQRNTASPMGLVLQTVAAGNEGRATFRFPNPHPEMASKPNPKDKSNEVSIDVSSLNWAPGTLASTHNVFFGTDEASVTNATVANPLGTMVFSDLALDSNNVSLGRLEYATTYYWRVDEVASSGTVTGKIWRFKTELKGYPILPASIKNVTSLGGVYPDEPDRQDPNSTCTGAGLDANDMHGTNMKTMWLGMDEGAYLKYEFDKAYKLYDMLVWNYNEEAPNNEYFGAKDVKVEYSLDGTSWTEVNDVPPFAMATGTNKCVANTQVLFNGVAAKYVKLTLLTGWGDMGLYGISEVRFSAEPTRATVPVPANAATGIAVETLKPQTLSWKAGRYAASHNVYISTDVNAVTNGTVGFTSTDVAAMSPSLELSRTYYWRVDEVNNAEAYPVWDGPVWRFSTASSIVVDNFETGYDDTEVNAVWATWIDGLGNSALGGSQMGNDALPFLSTNNYNGGHSAPIKFNNTAAPGFSEVKAQTVDLPIGNSNWTIGAPTTLVLWIQGNSGNNAATDRLYVKIGTAKILFTGDISKPRWYQMNVPLSTAGINPSNVSSITIGIEKIGATGGQGMVYVDNLRLYREAPALPLEELWIEAESATTVTAPLEKFSSTTGPALTGASGDQYIGRPEAGGNTTTTSPDPNGTATYTFTVTGGVYSIDYLFYTLGASGSSDSSWIRISDATAVKTTAGADVTLTPTGSTIATGWINTNNMVSSASWHWDTVISANNGNLDVRWTIPAGTHTLKISNREDGLMLDAIVIWKVSN